MGRLILAIIISLLPVCLFAGGPGMLFNSGAAGGGSSITHVGNWQNNTPGSSLSITVSGIQANDFVILYAVNDTGSGTNMTWPSGFTEQGTITLTAGDSSSLTVATKLATGGETSFATSTSGADYIAGCTVFRGVNTTTPLDVTAVVSETDTYASSPFAVSASITPATNGAMIVGVADWDVDASAGAISNVFSGGALSWSAGYSLDQSGGGFRHAAMGYATQSTAAAVTVTATGTAAGIGANRGIILLALRPA